METLYTEYTVVAHENLAELIEIINGMLGNVNAGWVCEGGICSTVEEYCQAMTRRRIKA